MSVHEIEIIQLDKIEPHPDPVVERMEITHVWGWQCCVGKGQFQAGGKAIFIPPDYLVPIIHPSFAFLERADGKPQERIRVKRLRGALSQGLIISVPKELDHLPVGANVIEQLGIERYIPQIDAAGENFIGGPSGLYCCKFDVESWHRWNNIFENGELVHVTEKMHGTSARYTYAQNADGEWTQFCGTRVNWVKEGSGKSCNVYWRAFDQCPAIGTWCQAHPEQIIYGEVFGLVKGFKYGAEDDTVFFAAFGILNQNSWLNFDEARKSANDCEVPWVPLLYSGPYDIEKIKKLAEEYSSWAGTSHMREGVVVLPHEERTNSEIGRVQLKIVSNRYLEKG